MMSQVSQNSETNLKQLFDEFKFHLIYRNKQSKVTQPISDQFKLLLEQLKQETRIKRSKKRAMQQAVSNQIKFNTHRPSSIQSRVWKPQSVDYGAIENINEDLLAVQNEKEFLNAQIGNLQISLAELKKNVAGLRKSVENQTIKQEKFKHITYLTHSIDRNTDSTKIINARAYKKMVELQEETLSNLKKFKTALRKQNQQLQSKYNQQKQTKEMPKHHMQAGEKRVRKVEGLNTKIDKTFITRLEELVQLLKSKEEEFEQIKVEQTTKIRLKKIQKQYLKQDRVKMHEMIDKFEQKYDVKIQSLANLIIFIFKQLNQDNDYMQRKCINLYQIKQSLSQDYQNICKKQGVTVQEQTGARRSVVFNENQLKKRIYANSQVFTKVILLLHNLIAKFKYLFTMALTMSKEKKNFHDLLIQIESLYKPQQIFHHEEPDSDDLDIESMANGNEIEHIEPSMNKESGNREIDWILGLIFTDVRNSLLCRKGWLNQQLKNDENGNIAEKVHNIQKKCDQVYDSKFKIYSLILINCLKALNMNKYEKKMIANSTAKESIFMSLPKEVKIYNLDDCSADPVEDYKAHPTETKFSCADTQEYNQEMFFSSDPMKIVKTLQKLKSQQKTVFRPLKLQEQKVYMYDRKVVLPKFIL